MYIVNISDLKHTTREKSIEMKRKRGKHEKVSAQNKIGKQKKNNIIIIVIIIIFLT